MKQTKSLVIGSGSIGERHSKNLVKFLNKKVYVLSRFPDKPFRDSYLNESENIEKISYSDLDKSYDIELLVLATPSSIRSEAFSEIQKIKPSVIYTEVPAAINYSSWSSLKKLSSELNAKLYAGYNMRFHPGINTLKELKDSRFLSLRGVFGEFLPDLHKWEDYRERYEAINALGGGPLLTSHHEIDLAILLMGQVKKVSCFMRNSHLDIDAADHSIIILFHKNGSVSNLDLNFFYKQYVRRLEIATEKGVINYEPFSKGINLGTDNLASYKDFDFNNTYIDSIKEALSKRNVFSPTNQDVDHLMKVTDACLKSCKDNGNIVDV